MTTPRTIKDGTTERQPEPREEQMTSTSSDLEKLVADLLKKLDRMVEAGGGIVWMDGVSPGTAYIDGSSKSNGVAAELCRRAAEMIRTQATALEDLMAKLDGLLPTGDGNTDAAWDAGYAKGCADSRVIADKSAMASVFEARATAAEAALREIAAEIVPDPDDHGPQQGPAHLWAWAQVRARSALSRSPEQGGREGSREEPRAAITKAGGQS